MFDEILFILDIIFFINNKMVIELVILLYSRPLKQISHESDIFQKISTS